MTRVRLGVEENVDQVFVLMPFRSELAPIYDIMRQAAHRAGLQIRRADEITSVGSITAQVSDSIARAGLVVADISNQNANVLFEIGIATSLGKETLLISQGRHHIPFDIAGQRVLFYENSITGAQALLMQLTEAMLQYAQRAGVRPQDTAT